MAIFINNYTFILEVRFETYRELLETSRFEGVFKEKRKDNIVIICIKDKAITHGPSINKHDVNIKIQGRNGFYKGHGAEIKINRNSDLFDIDDINKLHKGDRDRVKNFINHNKKYIIDFWDHYRDTPTDVAIQEECKKMIQFNLKKYDYEKPVILMDKEKT